MTINVSDLPPKYQAQAMKKYMEQQQRRGPAPPAAAAAASVIVANAALTDINPANVVRPAAVVMSKPSIRARNPSLVSGTATPSALIDSVVCLTRSACCSCAEKYVL